jgi:hypothetical protein
MTHTLVSLVLFLLALAFVVAVLLVPVAVLASDVFHAWGTTSAWEWIAEVLRRVFYGGLRGRLMRAVNAQRDIAVDRSRRTCANIAVSISTADVPALVGPSGDLARVAVDAARGYLRYARANGLNCDVLPQVVVVPEEWIRRGSVKARPVPGPEFAELWREMLAWDQDRDVPPVAVQDLKPGTLLLPDTARTVAVGPAETATAVYDPVGAPAMPSAAPRLVLTDTHGTRHSVSSASVIIGRGHDCEVRLDSPQVSREHVNVYFQEGTWWLRDRGSRNGTTVDGQQVQGTGPVRLFSGSRVVLGSDAAGEKLTVAGLGEL